MRSLKLWLLCAIGSLAFITWAFTQPIIQNTLSGNEVWRAAQGPGGPENYININTVRNGLQLTTISDSGAVTSTAIGGMLFWVGAAPTTWTVTMPSPAYNGEEVDITTDTTLTMIVTVNAGSNQSLHAAYTLQTLTALTPVQFFYNSSNTTWYRAK